MTEPPTVDDAPVRYPFPAPPSLFHPSPELTDLQAHRPVVQIRLPDGKTGWLVTRYDDVRQVLIDPRFSRAAAAGPDVPDTGLGQASADSILGMDPPEHTRLRRLVAGAFTARRVEGLRPRVATLVDELIDHLQTLPQPADLVENFSLPLPVQVICELLGVPAEDRHVFHGWSDTVLGDIGRDPAEIDAAFGAGVHHCLGAQLARMELQEALRGLLARMPRLAIATPVDELTFKAGMIVRSLTALPVRW